MALPRAAKAARPISFDAAFPARTPGPGAFTPMKFSSTITFESSVCMSTPTIEEIITMSPRAQVRIAGSTNRLR